MPPSRLWAALPARAAAAAVGAAAAGAALPLLRPTGWGRAAAAATPGEANLAGRVATEASGASRSLVAAAAAAASRGCARPPPRPLPPWVVLLLPLAWLAAQHETGRGQVCGGDLAVECLAGGASASSLAAVSLAGSSALASGSMGTQSRRGSAWPWFQHRNARWGTAAGPSWAPSASASGPRGRVRALRSPLPRAA